jgi:hypothetical protein
MSDHRQKIRPLSGPWLLLLERLRDLGRKVTLFLFDAFAELVSRESPDRDLLADLTR